MNFWINVTFSKVFAVVLFAGSVFIDLHNRTSLCVPVCLPVVGGIICVKQITDSKIEINEKS